MSRVGKARAGLPMTVTRRPMRGSNDIGTARAVGPSQQPRPTSRNPMRNPPVLPFRPLAPRSVALQGPEERLLASDLASIDIDSDTETEVAMYASENGIADLNRLQCQLGEQDGAANLSPAFGNLTTGSNLSQILIRDSEKLVFNGRVPAGAYDGTFGYDAWRQYGEPTVSLSSGDTIKVSVEQTSGAKASFGFGSAFRPNSINGRMVRIPWKQNAYNCWIGSDETTLTSGNAVTMTATVTQAGWLVLADVMFNAYLTATADDNEYDYTSRCFVTSFITDAYASTELVLSGSGKTACAPSSFFSAMRQERLVRFPIVRADSGNTVKLTVHNVSAAGNLTGCFAVPFIPLSQQLQPPCPPPAC